MYHMTIEDINLFEHASCHSYIIVLVCADSLEY